jgi:4-hydroxy-tetrahydrodipicolinate synthase
MPSVDDPSAPFGAGIWVPMVTPFLADEVDYPAAARLTCHLRKSGVQGLVACGTTGEGPALTTLEKARLLEVMFEAAGADMPVVLALEGANTNRLIAELRDIGRWPVKGYLLPAPSYVRPSPEGIRRHFNAVAEAADGPVMIYDIAARTGSTLSIELIAELAGTGCFPAIKACGFDDTRLAALIDIPGLSVFCGDDTAIFRALQLGAHGAVSASANAVPHALATLFEACRQDQLTDADRLWRRLEPIMRGMFAEPNPGPVKAVLAAQGLIVDGLRLPMTPCRAALRDHLANLVDLVNPPADYRLAM